uniref:KRAB domain-containing protein n=1 Tax=Dromaius novaehollandiae TaxID=8790 RepID=A0A8C4P8Q5_DRONO
MQINVPSRQRTTLPGSSRPQGGCRGQGGSLVMFANVIVSFSEDEWNDLEEWQKELYKDVSRENYQTLISLEKAWVVRESESKGPLMHFFDFDEAGERREGENFQLNLS